MATIRKRGDRWQAQVRRRGTTLSKTFILKSDAQHWAKQTEVEADKKGLINDRQKLERLSVADLLVRYRDEILPQKKSYPVARIIIDAFLRSGPAKTKLSDLSAEQFSSYRDQRLREVRPATINRELGLVQHVFEVARQEWGVPFAVNPVKMIRKPKADRPRERRLGHNEWTRLVEASGRSRNPLFKSLAMFALETGMRRGELLRARWKDVDWGISTLHIPVTKNGDSRTITSPAQEARGN